MAGIEIVMGGAMIRTSNARAQHRDAAGIRALLDLIESYNISKLDTARLYEDSEELIGSVSAGERVTIDTKARGGFVPGSSTREGIIEDARTSLRLLDVKQVDVYYLHARDDAVSLEDTLAGIHAVHQTGAFRRFGLSNFLAEDVQKVHDICKEKGYVLPSVYQGNYSAIARRADTMILPTLRRLGMAFYAYSPTSGGWFQKSKEDMVAGTLAGRFDDSWPLGKQYRSMYLRPAYLEGHEMWQRIVQDTGLAGIELALRWLCFSSPLQRQFGDAVIIGGNTLEHVKQSLDWIQEGPLDDNVVASIEAAWKAVERDAPLDNKYMKV